jgi:hypothetical protein
MEHGRYALAAIAIILACGGTTSHAGGDAGSVEVEAGAPCMASSDCGEGLECGWSTHEKPNCELPGVCVRPGCFGDGGLCETFGFPICGCDGRQVGFVVRTSIAQPSGMITTQIDYVSAPIRDGRCYPDGASGD